MTNFSFISLNEILIILFIAFIIIKIFDELDDNFPTSIASLNNYVKIHNSDCVEFTTTDILTKLDEIPDTCNISVQFQLAGNHKIIDLIKENYSEDKTLMRHYLPPNASLYSNLRQPSEDDYFDLESKIYYKCKDKNDKAFEKTKLDLDPRHLLVIQGWEAKKKLYSSEFYEFKWINTCCVRKISWEIFLQGPF